MTSYNQMSTLELDWSLSEPDVAQAVRASQRSMAGHGGRRLSVRYIGPGPERYGVLAVIGLAEADFSRAIRSRLARLVVGILCPDEGRWRIGIAGERVEAGLYRDQYAENWPAVAVRLQPNQPLSGFMGLYLQGRDVAILTTLTNGVDVDGSVYQGPRRSLRGLAPEQLATQNLLVIDLPEDAAGTGD